MKKCKICGIDKPDEQFKAFRAKDGEDVIDVVRVGHLAGECDERIADMLVVVAGNLLATTIVIIQMAKLDTQYGSLDFVKAAVTPTILKHVFSLRTIVGKRPDTVG